MKGTTAGVARRYARALLEVAREAGQADVVSSDLREALALLATHKELAGVLAHPALSPERKQKIVGKVWGEQSLLARLIALLVARGRLGLLGEIAARFTSLLNAERGVVAVAAVSAAALEPAQQAGLAGSLKRLTGCEVALDSEVDPALLGGLLVKVGGRVYDGSVRAQLQALRQRLSGARRS